MAADIAFDTDNAGTKTVQIVENSQLRNLTYGDVKNENTKCFLKDKLGEDLQNDDQLVFSKDTLSNAEEISLFNALVEEFGYSL